MVPTTLKTPQTTCSQCPQWQPSTRTPNTGECSLYHEHTLGHDKAGNDCPVIPEYYLSPIDEVGIEINVMVAGVKVGMIFFAIESKDWYAGHSNQPFSNAKQAADAVAIEWHRRQTIQVNEDTIAAAIRIHYKADIWPRDLVSWQEQRGAWIAIVGETRKPFLLGLKHLEAATLEIQTIEADIDRF